MRGERGAFSRVPGGPGLCLRRAEAAGRSIRRGVVLRYVIVLFPLICACAQAPVRDDSQLAELRGQVAAQSAQLAAQQRRIDALEMKVAAVTSRAEAKPA